MLFVYFVSPYFDHDAFMHHPMHVLDAPVSREFQRVEPATETPDSPAELNCRVFRSQRTNERGRRRIRKRVKATINKGTEAIKKRGTGVLISRILSNRREVENSPVETEKERGRREGSKGERDNCI